MASIVDEKRPFLGLDVPIPRQEKDRRLKKLAVFSAAAVAFFIIQYGRSIRLCRDYQGDDAHWAAHYVQTMPPGTEKNEKLFL